MLSSAYPAANIAGTEVCPVARADPVQVKWTQLEIRGTLGQITLMAPAVEGMASAACSPQHSSMSWQILRRWWSALDPGLELNSASFSSLTLFAGTSARILAQEPVSEEMRAVN